MLRLVTLLGVASMGFLTLCDAWANGYCQHTCARASRNPPFLSTTRARRLFNRKTRTATFCLNVALYVKEERRDEFLECIKNNEAGTMGTEPGALEYSWGESTSEPNTFFFHEKYKDKEGFEAHTKVS